VRDVTAYKQQPRPVIQPAAPGQRSSLVGDREMGGPVQPRQGPGRQLVKVAPGGQECLSNDILRQVCTDAPARVRKNRAVVDPEQLGESPRPAVC